MPMKISDVQAATALIINGYLRASLERNLADCLGAIRKECSDWAENLAADTAFMPPEKMSIDLNCVRSPANLANAIGLLARELCDLSGHQDALAAIAAASADVTAHAAAQ